MAVTKSTYSGVGTTFQSGPRLVSGDDLNSNNRKMVIDGLTAHASGGQESGTLLAKDFNRFTTVSTAADSATLPASVVGTRIVVVNATATAMAVFPGSGDKINDGSSNASISLAAHKYCEFFCTTAGNWYSNLSA